MKKVCMETAQAPVETPLAGEDFRQSPVENEVFRMVPYRFALEVLVHDLKGIPAQKAFHGGGQGFLVQLIHSGKTLCQDFAVGPVGTED